VKPKFIALICFGVAVATLGVWKVTSATRQQQLAELDAAKDKGSLNWRLRKAKIEGTREIFLSPLRVDYSCGGCDTEQLLSNSAVVVMQPVAKKSVVVDSGLVRTWYKFRILENLSGRAIPTCDGCSGADVSSIPEKLLPTKTDEILLSKQGGTVIIDNVRVTTKDPDYPEFEFSQKYLCPVVLANGVAFSNGGPSTVFHLSEGGTLESFNNKGHAFKLDMEGRFRNSLELFRQGLKNRNSGG
jgi:hypothetical protein